MQGPGRSHSTLHLACVFRHARSVAGLWERGLRLGLTPALATAVVPRMDSAEGGHIYDGSFFVNNSLLLCVPAPFARNCRRVTDVGLAKLAAGPSLVHVAGKEGVFRQSQGKSSKRELPR